MLSQKTIEIIKAITPLVAANAETLTRRFYVLLFENNPEVAEYFNPANQATGVQQRALADAICAYFSNIDNLDALTPAVLLIAHKHCSLGIKAEHYPVVGKNLLAAVQDVMGDAATPEIIEAIAEAYGELAQIFITVESSIYHEQQEKEGGWNGFRTFVVDRRVEETKDIVSFYFKALDGGKLPDYLPGQYLTLRIEDLYKKFAPRNYSLSDAPNGEYFRISVKRERACENQLPDGVISNHIHEHLKVGDKIELGPPCGEFVIDEGIIQQNPIVLIAGGIGITPLLAMAKFATAKDSSQPVHLLHVVRNESMHPFRSEIASLVNERQLKFKSYYSEQSPCENDPDRWKATGEWISSAVTEAKNSSFDDIKDAMYYVCGPKGFMKSAISQLLAMSIPQDRIRFEFFGPLQSTSENGAASCPFH